jgi:1,4-dihydroxy-2-naphthoate octaprenyltransferase
MTSQPTGPDRPLWGPPEGSAPEVQPVDNAHSEHAGHKWMMLICCIPMIAIVAVLIVSGTAGSGALLWALGCVAMMAAMMFMMPGGHNHK